MMVKDPLQLPDDLPVPEDDGAADHLAGMALPPVSLQATDGTSVRLDQLQGRTVVFAYPRTGRPGVPHPGATTSGRDPWRPRLHPAGVLVPRRARPICGG